MSFHFEAVPSQHAEVIHTHSRSFSMAARLLPKHVRRNTELLYAWCRWCDDAVDRTRSTEAAARQLDRLREDVERVYAGRRPQHQASAWLASVVGCCDIPMQLPLDLLLGMEMDLSVTQTESLDDLLTYCYHAAGCVGVMMCHVLGVRHRAALERACDLGIAMQLTNISRDVLEDWQRGRCYLPASWLDIPVDVSEPPESSRVKPLVAKMLTLADRYYERGVSGIPLLPRNVRPAIELAATLYRSIGTEIRRRDCDVMSGRVRLPKWRIAALACRPTGSWLSALALDSWRQFAANFFRKTSPIWHGY